MVGCLDLFFFFPYLMPLSLGPQKALCVLPLNTLNRMLIHNGTSDSILNTVRATISAPALNIAKLLKTWCLKSRQSRVSIGLYLLLALLVFLTSHAGSPKNIQMTLPDSKQVANIMTLIGFSFDSPNPAVTVYAYIPNQVKEPALDPNSASNNIPSYVVTYAGLMISFELPSYFNLDKAAAALNELRKIASIKVDHFLVILLPAKISGHEIFPRILSRVVNMVDCSQLEMCLTDDQEENPAINQIDWIKACLQEAQNTSKHAVYGPICELQFSPETKTEVFLLIYYGIALWRPISSLYLSQVRPQSLAPFNQFPLKKGYTIVSKHCPENAVFDFSSLPGTTGCGRIALCDRNAMELTIVGLENAVDKYSTVSLEVPWKALLYMSEHNASPIQVFSLRARHVSQSYIQQMHQTRHGSKWLKPKIFADKVTLEIDKNAPCNSRKYYKEVSTTDVFIKHGIKAKEIMVKYQVGRIDFDATMQFFVDVYALLDRPDVGLNKNIICCGDQLNDPDWTLDETVSIQLNQRKLSSEIKRYKRTNHLDCFCQNIHYAVIEIAGNRTPNKKQVERCISLLSIFQSITAQELKISNVRTHSDTTTYFDIITLRLKAAQQTKWPLALNTLVLDNVDEKIIYWMLGCYTFTSLITIYLQNQHFNNLAIAQILFLHPGPQEIGSLVINEFSGLHEVKHYDRRGKGEKFSLLRCIDNAQKHKRSSEDLGLHKLVLYANNEDYIMYPDAMAELQRHGIKIKPMLPKEYLTKQHPTATIQL
ncbi:hypothetical protein NEHOM01_0910 [Nematocida homosporus]|uniref:uncharacterized protein n=1 Tax=Nematocida homosporus TaxID=1912981 RepID=UPI00221F6B43|nr:uncharacterized protein NEHOM01_0910 [Nematocida homosporus]KAI5185551.1 hypothetical protein NEHOM01_0910 [Nematocida homosporus]